MKTPEQIRNMEFQKSAMGGYKQSDVELFLEEVASQIEILMKQKADADRKLQEFSQKAPEATLSTAGIQNVLISAQKIADQTCEDAKREAEQIVAQANLKVAEANIKAQEIIAEAESKAVLLGETAEIEAAKIIANAVAQANETKIAVTESTEIQNKLYDRLKIEVSDFKKKAIVQFAAISELINQLPDEIPFNMERAKDVLSVDFSNPQELLNNAVNAKLEKMRAEEEAAAILEEQSEAAIKIAEDLERAEDVAPVVVQSAVEETVIEEATEEEAPVLEEEEEQLSFDEVVDNATEEKSEEGFVVESVSANKGRISFGEEGEDDDDDDDDEPRFLFKRKK
jgi:cell division initiation protein